MKNKFLILSFAALISACSVFKKSGKESTEKLPKTINETPKETLVLMETSKGNIKLKLYNETPLHRDNFIKLCNQNFFDSCLFHRVIKSFMIQGGDPLSKNANPGQMLGNGDVGYKIPSEFNPNFVHKKGALAAARDNNPQKESSGCQFYIVQGKPIDSLQIETMSKRNGWVYTEEQKRIYKTLGGTPHLDNNYTVFGEVLEGLEVLDIIASVPCDGNNRPMSDVKIIKCRVVKK